MKAPATSPAAVAIWAANNTDCKFSDCPPYVLVPSLPFDKLARPKMPKERSLTYPIYVFHLVIRRDDRFRISGITIQQVKLGQQKDVCIVGGISLPGLCTRGLVLDSLPSSVSQERGEWRFRW